MSAVITVSGANSQTQVNNYIYSNFNSANTVPLGKVHTQYYANNANITPYWVALDKYMAVTVSGLANASSNAEFSTSDIHHLDDGARVTLWPSATIDANGLLTGGSGSATSGRLALIDADTFQLVLDTGSRMTYSAAVSAGLSAVSYPAVQLNQLTVSAVANSSGTAQFTITGHGLYAGVPVRLSKSSGNGTYEVANAQLYVYSNVDANTVTLAYASNGVVVPHSGAGTVWTGTAYLRSTVHLDFFPNADGTQVSAVRRMLVAPLNHDSPAPLVYNGPYELRLLQVDTDANANGTGVLAAQSSGGSNYVEIGTQNFFFNASMQMLAVTSAVGSVPAATDASTDYDGNAFLHFFYRVGADGLTLNGQRLTGANIAVWDDRPANATAYANLFNLRVEGSIGNLDVVILEPDSGSSTDILNILGTSDANVFTVVAYKSHVTAGGRNLTHSNVKVIAQDEGSGGASRSVDAIFTLHSQQVPSFSVDSVYSTTYTYGGIAASNANISGFANINIAGGTPDGSSPSWTDPSSTWLINATANSNATIQISFNGAVSDSVYTLANSDLTYTEWTRNFAVTAAGLPLLAYKYQDLSASSALNRYDATLHTTAPPDIGATTPATWYTDADYFSNASYGGAHLIDAVVTITGGLPSYATAVHGNLTIGVATATDVLLNNSISGSSRSLNSVVYYDDTKTYSGSNASVRLYALAGGNGVAYGTFNMYYDALTDGLTPAESATVGGTATATVYVFATLVSIYSGGDYDLNTASASGTKMIDYTSLFRGGVRFDAANGIVTTFNDPSSSFWSPSNGSVMVSNGSLSIGTVVLSSFVFTEKQRTDLSDTTYRQVSASASANANAYFYTVPTIAANSSSVYLNLNTTSATGRHANGGTYNGYYYWDVPWTYTGGHPLVSSYSVNTVYGGGQDVANGASPTINTLRQAPSIDGNANLSYYNFAFFDAGASSFLRVTILLSDPTTLVDPVPSVNSFTVNATFASYAPHGSTLWSSTASSDQTITFELMGWTGGAFSEAILTNYIDVVGDDAAGNYTSPGTVTVTDTESVPYFSDGINHGDGVVFSFTVPQTGVIPSSLRVTDTVTADPTNGVDTAMSGAATMTLSTSSDGVTGSVITFSGNWDTEGGGTLVLSPNANVTLGNAGTTYYGLLSGGVSGNAAEGGNLTNSTTAVLYATAAAINTSGGQDPRQTYYAVGTFPVSGLADATGYYLCAQRLGGANTAFAYGNLVYANVESGSNVLMNFVKNARYTVSNVTTASGAAKFAVVGHPFAAGDQVLLTQDSTYGSTFYYVKTVVDANSFTLSTTVGGSNMAYSGNGGGYVARVLGSSGFVSREGNGSDPNAQYGLCASGWTLSNSDGKALFSHVRAVGCGVAEQHGIPNGATVQVYGTAIGALNGEWTANVVSTTTLKLVSGSTEADYASGFDTANARVSIGVAILHDGSISDGDRFVLQLIDSHGLSTDLEASRAAFSRRMETRSVGRLWDFSLVKDYANSWLDCLQFTVPASSVVLYDADGVGTVNPNTANIQYVFEAKAANGFGANGANANQWVTIGCGRANLVQINANVLVQLPERALSNVLHYSQTSAAYFNPNVLISYRLHARNGAATPSGNGITVSDYVTRTYAGSTRTATIAGTGLLGWFQEGVGDRRVLNDVCLTAANGGPANGSGSISDANAVIVSVSIEGQLFPQTSSGSSSVNVWGFTDLVSNTQPPNTVNLISNGARFIDPLT